MSGRLILTPSCGALLRPRVLADLDGRRVVAGVHLDGVGPAEHPLVPEAHVRGHRLEDRSGVRTRAHEVPEVDVGVADTRGVVQVGQAEVVAVLVREHADARVLGLHDVVRELEVGAGDVGAAGDRRRVRPERVGALGTAAARLVFTGVHEHDVVDHAIGLEHVAVVVAVALVFDVVVGPREVGLRLGECRNRVDGQLARAERVVGVALHVLDRAGLVDARLVLEAEARAVVGLGVGHGDPRGRLAGHGVGAARHLLVHGLHRVARDVEAGLVRRGR